MIVGIFGLAILIGIVILFVYSIIRVHLKKPYTVEDVLSGKVTRDQYVDDYRRRNGYNSNPDPDERIFPQPTPPPPLPPDYNRVCNCCKKYK